MDESINQWLQTYEPIEEIALIEEIHYTGLTESSKNLALQRIGFEELPLKYITSTGWLRRYSYMLLLKSDSEDDIQRLTNLDWLDDLSIWLSQQNKDKNFPILDNGREVKKVSCANALTYDSSEDGSQSVYSLQIFFEVRKEN